jgi:single-strand DNA-binding protein
MSFNKIIILGNVTKDIELRYTPSGTAVASFGIATNRKFKVNNEQRDEAMFIDVSAFGKQAELLNEYVKKGDQLLIEGRLKLEQWEDQNGNKRSKHTIFCESMQFMSNRNQDGNNNNRGGYQQQNNRQNNRDYGGQPASNYNSTNMRNQSHQNQQNTIETESDGDEIPF